MPIEPGSSRGAHGLRIVGLEEGASRLGKVPDAFPMLGVVRDPVGPAGPPLETVDGHVRFLPGRAEIGIARRGSILIEETSGLATFSMRPPPTDEEVLHPYLSTIAAVRARWNGHDAFHAGAFVLDGSAWGVLGRRRAGKSTLLAYLARQALSVVSDDLLVVDRGGAVFAGPRFVDLRREAAARLVDAEPLGRVGARTRWRLSLDSIEPSVPLRGWLVLGWSRERVAAEAVPPASRVRLLAEALAIGAPPEDPVSLLRLSWLPMLKLARPRNLASIGESCAVLLERLRAV